LTRASLGEPGPLWMIATLFASSMAWLLPFHTAPNAG
jgi:hypothetical protein